MIRILDYLPQGAKVGGPRQTLLFSATQTKKVADLAALSLHKPEYIGVHDKVKTGPTPESLQQSYVVVPLGNKLDTIYSFIKSHLKKKSIVFFNSCSQVRHAYDLFCSLQPGVPLLALHGKLKQEIRTKVYFDYLQRPSAVLFSTDVASRGLDFPNVDWVVQADAPEDKDMYIHRVGRTARYTSGGRAMLCLLPSEEVGMRKILNEAQIPVKKLSINPTKTVVVSQQACGIVASKPALNALAKKAYKSYLRSVYLMPDKDVFKVEELPLDEFATSLGLAATPSVRFLKDLKGKSRDETRGAKNKNYKLEKLKAQIKAEKLQKKLAKMGKSAMDVDVNVNKDAAKRKRDDNDDGGLLLVKKRHEWNDGEEDDLPNVDINEVSHSRSDKRIRIDGNVGQNKRVVFNDDGEEEENNLLKIASNESGSNLIRTNEIASANEDFMRRVKDRLKSNAELDRMQEKERIREKHKMEKLKAKGLLDDDGEDEDTDQVVVTLGGSGMSDNEVVDSDEGNDDGDDDGSSASSSGGSSSSSDDDEDSSSSGSSSSDEETNEAELKKQEDLALALIQGRS